MKRITSRETIVRVAQSLKKLRTAGALTPFLANEPALLGA
jgi:hypothetical protein